MFVVQRIHSRHSRWDLFDKHMQQVASDVKQRFWQVRCKWFILQREQQYNVVCDSEVSSQHTQTLLITPPFSRYSLGQISY